MNVVRWQERTYAGITDRLPPSVGAIVKGSAATPELLDGWSDLDLEITAPQEVSLDRLLGGAEIWCAEDVITDAVQVLRVVLADGRRLDLTVVGGGRVVVSTLPPVNTVRFVAVQAAVKLGRGDRVIGLHLLLELHRLCLVEAMVLRDREVGTTRHRYGRPDDTAHAEVSALLHRLPDDLPPDVVREPVALFDRWHAQLDPDYRPDWSGLDAVLDLGRGRPSPTTS